MKNPFVTNGYVSPEYFCDREKETAKIVSLLTNENNIALISPRRLGKTDLLRHCFGQPEIKEHYHTFIIDIYAAREKDTLGISSQNLQARIRENGHSCYYFASFEEIEDFVLTNCTKGDLLITMGAGDVVKIGETILQR